MLTMCITEYVYDKQYVKYNINDVGRVLEIRNV